MTRMMETWDICNLKNLHLRSLCDHILWIATPACLTKTIVGEVLIASTDQGNLKLVIVRKCRGGVGVCFKPAPCE